MFLCFCVGVAFSVFLCYGVLTSGPTPVLPRTAGASEKGFLEFKPQCVKGSLCWVFTLSHAGEVAVLAVPQIERTNSDLAEMRRVKRKTPFISPNAVVAFATTGSQVQWRRP